MSASECQETAFEIQSVDLNGDKKMEWCTINRSGSLENFNGRKMKIVYTLALSFVSFCVTAQAQTLGSPLKQVQADLNGDGKIDSVRLDLSAPGSSAKPTLIVNNAHIMVEGYGDQEGPDGFVIVDSNQKDKSKEIAVHSVAMTDTAFYNLYRYDGIRLTALSKLPSPVFRGDGTITIGHHMGFWQLREILSWNEAAKTFNYVPQEFYTVSDESGVVQYPIVCELDLYTSRRLDSAKLHVKPGHKADVLLFYDGAALPEAYIPDDDTSQWGHHKGWYWIRTDDGVSGWVNSEQMRSQCFEGLVMAG